MYFGERRVDVDDMQQEGGADSYSSEIMLASRCLIMRHVTFS
jgi:hypothetical protein